MDNLLDTSKVALHNIERLLPEIEEVCISRTNYVLRQLIVCEHDMPGRQRMQVLTELRAILFDLAELNAQYELTEIEIEEKMGKEFIPEGYAKRKADLEINRLMIQNKSIELTIRGRLREVAYLFSLLDELPAYTKDELEAEEPIYWQRRTTRQAYLNMRGNASGIGYGDLEQLAKLDLEIGEERPALILPEVLKQAGGLPGNGKVKLVRG